jgi:hypothetical protein
MSSRVRRIASPRSPDSVVEIRSPLRAVRPHYSLVAMSTEIVAMDVMRAIRLEQRGYRVWTHTSPAAITLKNRLLLGEPL